MNEDILKMLVRQKHDLTPGKPGQVPEIRKKRRVKEALVKLMMMRGNGPPG